MFEVWTICNILHYNQSIYVCTPVGKISFADFVTFRVTYNYPNNMNNLNGNSV